MKKMNALMLLGLFALTACAYQKKGADKVVKQVLIPVVTTTTQEVNLVDAVVRYYKNEGKWPGSINELKNFYHQQVREGRIGRETNQKINWRLLSSFQLKTLENGNLEIDCSREASFGETFSDTYASGSGQKVPVKRSIVVKRPDDKAKPQGN